MQYKNQLVTTADISSSLLVAHMLSCRNDPDFLMTGGAGCDDFSMSHCPGQTDIEYKTEFSIWCDLSSVLIVQCTLLSMYCRSITASPLLVSTDIRNMTSIMKEILLNKVDV